MGSRHLWRARPGPGAVYLGHERPQSFLCPCFPALCAVVEEGGTCLRVENHRERGWRNWGGSCLESMCSKGSRCSLAFATTAQKRVGRNKVLQVGATQALACAGQGWEVGAHLDSQLQGEEAFSATQPFLRVGRENNHSFVGILPLWKAWVKLKATQTPKVGGHDGVQGLLPLGA